MYEERKKRGKHKKAKVVLLGILLLLYYKVTLRSRGQCARTLNHDRREWNKKKKTEKNKKKKEDGDEESNKLEYQTLSSV